MQLGSWRCQGVNRLPNDGLGQKRSRVKFIKQRAAQRRLASLRRIRRPSVQGRRRLWGKGPAPLHYTQRNTSIAKEPDSSPPNTPSSVVACFGSPSATAGLTPSPAEPAPLEPLDESTLEMLGHHLHDHSQKLQGLRGHGEFRALARQAGIRL